MDKKKDILKKLEMIETKVDMIYDLLSNDIKPDCNKMGNHIDFVEQVYDYVKYPLFYICNRISSSENSLIENKDNISYISNKNVPNKLLILNTLSDNDKSDEKTDSYEIFTNKFLYLSGFLLLGGIYYKYYR